MEQVTQRLSRKGVLKSRAHKSHVNYIDIAKQWLNRAMDIGLSEIRPNKISRKEWGQTIDLDFHDGHLGERSSTWTMLETEVNALTRNLGRAKFESIKSSIRNAGKVCCHRCAAGKKDKKP